MNTYVNIKVSATISTDFIIEVPEGASKEKIKELAEKEVILPHTYPTVIDQQLLRMGIRVQGIDSMLKAWDLNNVKYIIDNE